MNINFLLEEVAGLTAQIEGTPDLPFAHLAAQQATIATNELETALAQENTNIKIPLSLRILRKIATTHIVLDIPTADEETIALFMYAREDVSNDDNCAFITACAKGFIDVVRLFLERGLDLTADGDLVFRGACRMACRNGRIEIVRELIDLPWVKMKIHEPCERERFVPMFIEGVKILRKEHVYSFMDDMNEVGLYEACDAGHVDIVRLLLEKGVVPAIQMLSPAFRGGHTEIICLLLNFIEPSTYHNSALREACRLGNIDIVRFLLELPLERGVDPSACENNALMHACSNGHTEIVRLLLELPLERGVDPTTNEHCALRLAIKYGYTEICNMLRARTRWFGRLSVYKIRLGTRSFIHLEMPTFNGIVEL